MWLAVKALILRWVLARSVGGLLSVLLVLAVPLAGVLKVIGLPLLFVLGIVALPMILVLAVIGLPILLVVGTVGVVMAVVGSLLAAGIALLKIALPIILIFLVGRWAWGRIRASRGDAGPTPGSATGPVSDPPAGFDPGI